MICPDVFGRGFSDWLPDGSLYAVPNYAMAFHQFLARVGELYARPTLSTQDELHLLDGRVLERYSAPQRTGDRVVGRVWRFHDVTAERRLRADLERQAYTDPLTGLPNRTRFMHDLQAALDAAWELTRHRVRQCLATAG